MSIGYFILGKNSTQINTIMESVALENELVYGEDVVNLMTSFNQTEIVSYP